jgi:hypothetical protein
MPAGGSRMAAIVATSMTAIDRLMIRISMLSTELAGIAILPPLILRAARPRN